MVKLCIWLLIFYHANWHLMHVRFLSYLAQHFSKLLKDWIPTLAKSDKTLPVEKQGLPE